MKTSIWYTNFAWWWALYLRHVALKLYNSTKFSCNRQFSTFYSMYRFSYRKKERKKEPVVSLPITGTTESSLLLQAGHITVFLQHLQTNLLPAKYYYNDFQKVPFFHLNQPKQIRKCIRYHIMFPWQQTSWGHDTLWRSTQAAMFWCNPLPAASEWLTLNISKLPWNTDTYSPNYIGPTGHDLQVWKITRQCQHSVMVPKIPAHDWME